MHDQSSRTRRPAPRSRQGVRTTVAILVALAMLIYIGFIARGVLGG